MKIDRFNAQPSKHTFTIPPIFKFVYLYFNSEKYWVDPMCGYHSPVAMKFSNDLNPEIPAKYHMDALAFLKLWESNSLDGVIVDPPYSLRQVKECYQNIGIYKVPMEETQAQVFRYTKEIIRVLKPGGLVLKFGWNSSCLDDRHFVIKHVRIVNHGGNHNDTICTMQKKINTQLEQFL